MIFDALIIGGGPAGAATALLLQQGGLKVALLEKQHFPRRKVCGEFISATSFPVLEKLALHDFFMQHAGPQIKRLGLFAANKMIITKPNVNWGRALGRDTFDSILLHKAENAGVNIWQPASLVSFTREHSLFVCKILTEKNRAEIKARMMIVALGSWDTNTFTKKIKHQASDLLAFKAHFKETALASDIMPLIAFPGGYGGMVGTNEDRVTISLCIRRDTLAALRSQTHGKASEVVFQHIMQTSSGVHHVLRDAKREGSWLAAGPIRPGIRRRYHDGIFYVGNSTGEAHPIIAEGISMALQSACLLSQILIRRRGEALDYAGVEYAKCWHQHFARRIHVAKILAHFAMRPWAMQMLSPIFTYFPTLLNVGAMLSGKMQQISFP